MNVVSKRNQTLSVLSWNVNGLTQKKSYVFGHLRVLQADVIFLQETHIGSNTNCPSGSIQIQNLEPDFEWSVYTVFKRNCRGVAILFRKGLGCEGLQVVGDEKGRYIVISCKIQEQEFVFVNVYNPTDEKIDFVKLRDFFTQASEATCFVLGGDFNTVMDAKIDKTSNNKNRGHRDRFKGLMDFLESFNLVDVWRWLYPEEKSFTHFDVKGKSRLDYFFLPVRMLTSVTACKIHKRPQNVERQGCISDHAPISVQIQMGGHRRQVRSDFLKDEALMERLSGLIEKISAAQQVKKGDLWPALKVRVACEMLALNKGGDDFQWSGHLAEVPISQVYPEMHPVDQKCLTAGGHIQILRSQPTSEPSDLKEYLDYLYEKEMFEDIELTLHAILTEQISKKEILSAILSLINTEHLRPDGLPGSFYKYFASKIVDLLQAFFNQVLDLQSVMCVFNESFTLNYFATTTLSFINTDHTYCSNVQRYRQASIFNVDYTILALVLAERLKSIMGYLLNKGKTRPHLSVQDCVHVFEKIQADSRPVLVFSVNVDPGDVRWLYVFSSLQTLNLPDRFRSIIQSLMLPENRTVNRSGVTSAYSTSVPLSRALKVGCPLTPVLISICLLPFIHSINKEDRIQGVRIGGEHIKSVLDKDRAIIFLSYTSEGLDIFEELLKDFMKNSGFVIDSGLSEVFTTGHAGLSLKKELFKLFKTTHDGFWYKGVLIGSEEVAGPQSGSMCSNVEKHC